MIPPLLASILRDFCHVEWYEMTELKEFALEGQSRFDVALFRRELVECILSYPAIPLVEINGLTGNEFATQDEARQWLVAIQQGLFET